MSESKNQSEEEKAGQAIKEDPEQIEETSEAAAESVVSEIPKPDYEKDYLYLRAEFENFKKQSIKERSQLLKYGAERLAVDLLETIDVFKSALENEVTADNFEEFVKGVQLTEQHLRSSLERHGIKEIPCKGEAFDPNKHEALSSIATDEVPPGHIVQVFKAPFTYHEKLIRPGQVVVAKEKTLKE